MFTNVSKLLVGLAALTLAFSANAEDLSAGTLECMYNVKNFDQCGVGACQGKLIVSEAFTVELKKAKCSGQTCDGSIYDTNFSKEFIDSRSKVVITATDAINLKIELDKISAETNITVAPGDAASGDLTLNESEKRNNSHELFCFIEVAE